MSRLEIQILVDWSKSFVDSNGSFYCGTTASQKERAVECIRDSDLWIYTTDVHSSYSSEFTVNGGRYPAHNIVKSQWDAAQQLNGAAGKTVSPELTDRLQDRVK